MILTHLHRLEKILEQDFTWMDGWKVAFSHCLTSVIINYFDVKGNLQGRRQHLPGPGAKQRLQVHFD